jgi:hypothetical protein
MSRRPDPLFSDDVLSDRLRSVLDAVKDDVDGISEAQFVRSSDEELLQHVFSKREIAPLELYEDQKIMEQHETKVDVRHDFGRAVFDSSRPCLVDGIRIVVSIPFTGQPYLWRCRPNQYTLNPPCARIRPSGNELGGSVDLVAEHPVDRIDESKIKADLDKELNGIRENISGINAAVTQYNEDLHSRIRDCVKARRKRLEKYTNLAKTLDIPLKRDPSAPDVSKLPIKRKLVKPLPPKSDAPAEPGIRGEDFEHILRVIRHEGRSFETAPGTFAAHGEEGLRDIILAHLNGHYEGAASGETFRKQGKTDIRIEKENRAAFVAECKVWQGQKQITAALDQLLGYLTWRDCKAALIVFNKDRADFSELQKRLEEGISKHAACDASLPCKQAGEWRFRFHAREDPGRKIDLHVFFFDLHVPAPD